VPSQQATTLATIETAMLANIEAIIQSIQSNPTLAGNVTWIGPMKGRPIEIRPNPGGPLKDKLGAMWVTFDMAVPFIGNKTTF
jgi:hypothetical protein